jgi:hypothetical protein
MNPNAFLQAVRAAGCFAVEKIDRGRTVYILYRRNPNPLAPPIRLGTRGSFSNFRRFAENVCGLRRRP